MFRNLWIGSIFLLGAASTLQAQTPACSYDRCAIRIESSFFATRLVAGQAGVRVARLGLFPPAIPEFEQASDSVRTHYMEFRSAKRTSAWLGLLSIGLVMGAAIAAGPHVDHDTLSGTLLVSGIAIGIGTGFAFRKASNHLERAVWWYNRDLPERS